MANDACFLATLQQAEVSLIASADQTLRGIPGFSTFHPGDL